MAGAGRDETGSVVATLLVAGLGHDEARSLVARERATPKPIYRRAVRWPEREERRRLCNRIVLRGPGQEQRQRPVRERKQATPKPVSLMTRAAVKAGTTPMPAGTNAMARAGRKPTDVRNDAEAQCGSWNERR